jgi:hypothetical protein
MEDILDASLVGIKLLKAELTVKNKSIDYVTCKINIVQQGPNKTNQYQWSLSMRIANISPPPQQKKKAHYCSQDQVYDLPLRPILVEASILPSKAGTAKPVITRFYLPEATEGVCAEEGVGGRGGGTVSG